VLEDKGLRNYGTDAARTEQAGQGSNEMDKKNDQIAHRRIVAGREILRAKQQFASHRIGVYQALTVLYMFLPWGV
jgi:hypothetical protein